MYIQYFQNWVQIHLNHVPITDHRVTDLFNRWMKSDTLDHMFSSYEPMHKHQFGKEKTFNPLLQLA